MIKVRVLHHRFVVYFDIKTLSASLSPFSLPKPIPGSTQYINVKREENRRNIPANECNVLPPIFTLAIPVDAVTATLLP